MLAQISSSQGLIATGGKPQNGLSPLSDAEFADQFAKLSAARGQVLLVVNSFTACAYHRISPADAWKGIGRGDLASAAINALKPFARKRLFWARVPGLPVDVEPTSVSFIPVQLTPLRAWLKAADDEAGTGRHGGISPEIKEELLYVSAWRCQFAGCGCDLRRHPATGGRARFTYFAHIVAASTKGPRGDPVLSPQLASEPSNFLVLCDACHRLIDKIDPEKYTVALLHHMREESVSHVQRLLGTLSYPRAEVVAIIGNIAGQAAPFSMDDAHEALWAAQLRNDDAKPARYFQTGGQHHDVHSAGYWLSLFTQLKSDLPRLQTLLNGTATGTSRPRLAVFPLHGTSTLLLAGRVLGDNGTTELFQPHRNKVGRGTRWSWPSIAPQPTPDKFKLEVVHPFVPGNPEAVLVVALTSEIGSNRFPQPCVDSKGRALPTLRITGPTFDSDCIQHPEDLQRLGIVVDQALKRLHDEWKVEKVHLFVSAPASAVVVIGQKMQARHHATFVCYEAAVGAGSAYKATIEIQPVLVRELVTGQSQSISLQP